MLSFVRTIKFNTTICLSLIWELNTSRVLVRGELYCGLFSKKKKKKNTVDRAFVFVQTGLREAHLLEPISFFENPEKHPEYQNLQKQNIAKNTVKTQKNK